MTVKMLIGMTMAIGLGGVAAAQQPACDLMEFQAASAGKKTVPQEFMSCAIKNILDLQAQLAATTTQLAATKAELAKLQANALQNSDIVRLQHSLGDANSCLVARHATFGSSVDTGACAAPTGPMKTEPAGDTWIIQK